MRFALVVEPPKDGGPLDRLAPLRERIARAGFNIVRLHAGASLSRDVARAIAAAEHEDTALVYLACDVQLAGGESILLLGGEPTPLADVAAVVGGHSLAHLLFVVDARCQGERGDALHAVDHVEAIVRDVASKDRGASLVVAVESAPLDTPPSFALSRFFGAAIDDPGALAPDGTMLLSAAWARMRSHPEFAVSVPSFSFVKGPSDFVVVAPIVERVSEAPPASRMSALPMSTRPPSRRAGVPLPAIEPILAQADRARDREAWDEALDGYKKALMIAGEGDPPLMASLYASVAEVKLAQGKGREAEANFEKALGVDSSHARSLSALAKMAVLAKEWGRAGQFERKVARTKGTDDAKVDALLHVAARFANDARDPSRAAEVLDEARAIRPDDPRLLEASRAVYEALRQWKKLAEVLGALADARPLLHDKAQRRFEQADVLLGRLRDEPAGIAALESALEDDPTHEKALAAIVAVRTRRQEWKGLEVLYAKLVERFAQREDAQRAWEIVKRLGQLRRDKLIDGPGAVEAFTAAVRLKPKDVESRAALAELHVAKGDRDGAIVELEACARYEPTRAATHRRLYELHRKLGHTDRAWLAATALEELKGADVDQQMLADQFRGDPPRPNALFDESEWNLLRAPGHDPVIEEVLAAIVPIAVAAKTMKLREERRLVALDPARRQSPESTATVVRMFVWASKVLDVALPDLYLLDEVAGGIAAVQAAVPSTALGPSVMSGKKVPELAFLVARHLVYYRPEHYPLIFYPTLPDLSALLLAAVKLARPELPIPSHAAATAGALRKELAEHATEAQRKALSAAVEKVESSGGKMELASWMRGVELTAARAGLLLCGDLATALSTMRTERRAVGDLGYDERRGDLLAFTASRALADARARLGLAAKGSVPPPPGSGPLPR
jgi:tetratricopeptide (TPR) repeat protein